MRLSSFVCLGYGCLYVVGVGVGDLDLLGNVSNTSAVSDSGNSHFAFLSMTGVSLLTP